MGPYGRRAAGLSLERMLDDVVYSSSHLPLMRGDDKDLAMAEERKIVCSVKADRGQMPVSHGKEACYI